MPNTSLKNWRTLTWSKGVIEGTLSNLETAVEKETEAGTSEVSPLGFPQSLHQSEPLDRETLSSIETKY